MTKSQEQIKEFMIKAGQDVPPGPTASTAKVRELRVKLIAEELAELAEALNIALELYTARKPSHFCARLWDAIKQALFPDRKILVTADPNTAVNLVDVYDALVDIQYVNEGAGVAFGLDMEPGFEEVHDSNMSKFIDGHKRPDGKWIKGPSYRPANLNAIVNNQRKGVVRTEA
jgi:predicted HAD superfamily Cof-like phosphohydrolase